MPFPEWPLLNISIISLAGMGIGLLVFSLYCAICQYINEERLEGVFSISNFKNKNCSFIIIIIVSILIINFLFYKYGYGTKFLTVMIFAYLMLLLAAIDFKTQMLPDIITKPLIGLGLVQGYIGVFTDLQSSVLGAIAGYMVLWSVNYCFRLVRGVEGMGYGDFKLLSSIGAWVGIKILPLVILLSSIIGIFVALVIIKLTKSNIKAPTPFGPSLVFTGFVAIIYGNDIITWYLKILGVT